MCIIEIALFVSWIGLLFESKINKLLIIEYIRNVANIYITCSQKYFYIHLQFLNNIFKQAFLKMVSIIF